MRSLKKTGNRVINAVLHVAPLVLLASPALAQQVDNHSESLGAALVRTGAALLFILGLFFILVYLMKKFWPNMFGNPNPGGTAPVSRIDLLSTRPIGQKRFLHLIRVGKKEILIGSSEQTINKLAEWEASETREAEKSVEDPSA